MNGRRYLTRRTLLRGAGVAIALPPLEAMMDGRGRLFNGRAFAAGPPIRFVAVGWVNGVDQGHTLWRPKSVGAGFDLPPGLAPLAKWKNDINVLSGLNMDYSSPNVRIFQHAAGEVSRFTCMPATYDPRPAGVEVPIRGGGGPSLEWLLAQRMPKETLVPAVTMSLPLTSYREGSSSWWIGKEQPAPMIFKPIDLFNKLFKTPLPSAMPAPAVPPPPDPKIAMRKSVLHFAKDSATRLRAQLGAGDKQRLDQHLTAIEEIERQMSFGADGGKGGGGAKPTADCRTPATPGAANDDETTMKLYAQLLGMAFRCDLVRYAAIDIHKIKPPTHLGPVEDDHATSHLSASPAFTYYLAEKMRYLGMLLDEMKGSPEGDKDVLYNSIVYTVSDIARGPHHDWGDMPALMAGNARGQIKTGRHLRYQNVTINNLHTALIKYVGVPIDKYGSDATGPLPGLDT